MPRAVRIPLLALSLLLAASCRHKAPDPTPTPPNAETAVVAENPNPLLQASTLPYLLPPFEALKDAHFQAAIEAGMAEQRQEMDAIAKDAAPATFDNTLVAMERSGALLTRAMRVFSALNSSFTNDELQRVEEELAPKLSAHSDAILLDSALFARVHAVYAQKATLGLDPESAQLLERVHEQFERAGAALSDADKARLKAMNEEMSTLSTQFGQNTRKAMKDGGVVVDTVAELAGLSGEQIGAAAEAGKSKGLDGKWVIALQNTTTQPVLAQLENRALRERIFRASSERAVAENTPLVAKLVALRAEKAALLGYPSYAAYVLEDVSAKTPENVNKMLADLAPTALAKAKAEAKDVQAAIAADGQKFTVAPWDWQYYAEKVRVKRYAFDESQVKPYFELNRVLVDGVFHSATALYGITFTERTDLKAYAPDVKIWEVKDADGSAIGLFLTDFFQRDNKQGGAWMTNYVDQTTLLGTLPVVVNNLNVPKPADGQPALLTFDEVTTMFHEFGHALHGLLSDTKYPTLSGTNTPPDFVEFPSQFNEMWAREPAVLQNYAKHYQTGEAMPKALFDKVLAAQTFDQGYATLEYLQAAKLDQTWHQVSRDKIPAADGVMAFEDAALNASGMQFAPVPPRYRSPYFNHIFAGGYEAGYYAYIWSEVLARDSGAYMHAHGGLTRENGDRLRQTVLSKGRTAEPSVLFESFYGAPPDVGPLLEYRGLGTPK